MTGLLLPFLPSPAEALTPVSASIDLSWESRHGLLTGLVTNSQQSSEALSAAAWATQGVLVTDNQAIAPEGGLVADDLKVNAAGGIHRIAMTALAVTDHSPQSVSTHVKLPATNPQIHWGFELRDKTGALSYVAWNLQTGALTRQDAGILAWPAEYKGDGWWRISATLISAGTGATLYRPGIAMFSPADGISPSYTGDNLAHGFLWGSQNQLNVGAVGRYIKTTNAAASGQHLLGLDWESLQGVSQSAVLPWESLAAVLVLAPVVLSWESLGRVAAGQALSWESLQGLAVAREIGWESRQGVQMAQLLAWESQQGVRLGVVLDWESLAGVSAARLLAWESKAGVSAAVILPWESLAAAGLVVAPVTLHWESLAGVRAAREMSLEWLQSVMATQLVAYESLQGVRLAVVLPWESQQGVVVPTVGLVRLVDLQMLVPDLTEIALQIPDLAAIGLTTPTEATLGRADLTDITLRVPDLSDLEVTV